MKENIKMKEQLSDIERTIWGCPVRVLMSLLYLVVVSITWSHWQRRHLDTNAANLCAVPAPDRRCKLSHSTPWLTARKLHKK
jgi:hypothetical protein